MNLGGEELKTPKLALLLAVGLFIIIPSISAQEEEVVDAHRVAEQSMTFDEGSAVTPFGTGPSIWAVIRMILVLALAAAAIYGAVFFIKRTTKQTANTDPFLKVLANAHLGSNRYAHVIHIGNKAWLVGSSDGGVNVIGEVEDKDTINAMLLEDSRKAAEVPQGRIYDFMSMVKRFGASVETKTPGADEIRKRRERLKGL